MSPGEYIPNERSNPLWDYDENNFPLPYDVGDMPLHL